MMHIQLDFRSGQPIYIQIVEQIRQMVVNGELRPGDQLPTVRQLAADLRVNFNTVARAYRLLDEAGLISTQHGRGTYVWEAPSDESLQRLRWQGLEGLMKHCILEALRLGYSKSEIHQAFEQQVMMVKESDEHEEG
jgi:GntR family transcriptional regulator